MEQSQSYIALTSHSKNQSEIIINLWIFFSFRFFILFLCCSRSILVLALVSAPPHRISIKVECFEDAECGNPSHQHAPRRMSSCVLEKLVRHFALVSRCRRRCRCRWCCRHRRCHCCCKNESSRAYRRTQSQAMSSHIFVAAMAVLLKLKQQR